MIGQIENLGFVHFHHHFDCTCFRFQILIHLVHVLVRVEVFKERCHGL